MLLVSLIACSPSDNSKDDNVSQEVGDGDNKNPEGQPPETNEWLLANSHEAIFPLSLVFPKDADSNSWAYNKNAYPDIRWQIPIGVRGGRWPYRYQIKNNGGADGLVIGETLARSIDPATQKTLHQVDDNYGVLTWPAPKSGVYQILVSVIDQDSNAVEVPINLTVAKAGWLFIDSVNGSDDNDGSLEAPFKTLEKLHNNDRLTTTFSQHRIILREGVIPLDGVMPTSNPATNFNQHYKLRSDNLPLVYVAYPDEKPILEAYQGHINMEYGNDDFYMAGVTYRYALEYLPSGDFYMFRQFGQSKRMTWFNNHFQDFQGTPLNVEWGNSAIIFSNDEVNYDIAVIRNQVGGGATGKSGTLLQTYAWRNALIEHNVIRDTDITTVDASTHAAIWIKSRPLGVTIRANEIYKNITASVHYSGLGIGGTKGARDVEVCYNKVSRPHSNERSGGFLSYNLNSSSGLFQNIYWYRNSIAEKWQWEGQNYPEFSDGEDRIFDNVLHLGTMPVHSRINAQGNVDGEALLDLSTMNLHGDARQEHLGQKGAELAH